VLPVNREPQVDKFALALPMIEVDSVGAGGGTIARIDPQSNRLVLGPESAGADPGPICHDAGGEAPTITDADLILGYLDPEYFLGGRIKLNKEKTLKIFEEKIAKPMGLDVYAAAYGVRTIIDSRMQGLIRAMVLGRGFEPQEYHLLAFGGGGPSHVAGYTNGLDFKGVLIFPFSSVFSAFGASVADYSHSYTRSVNVTLSHDSSEDLVRKMCQPMNEAWERLEQNAIQQMEAEGYAKTDVTLIRQAMIRYTGQLNDVVVPSPVARINTIGDWRDLVAAYEDWYSRIYSSAGKYSQAGYQIFEVGLVSKVEKVKPSLREYKLGSAKPKAKALAGMRSAYFDGKFVETPIYSMDELQAGNEVQGPAFIEHATTTVVMPPGKKVYLDKYRTMWLSKVD